MVQPGDVLRIQLRDGSSVGLLLTAASATALTGTDPATAAERSVAVADIVSIERKETDALKTVLLVVSGLLVVYAFAYAKALSKLLGTTP